MNTHGQAEPRLGIDIGRVIISPVADDGGDTQFIGGSEEQALRTPENTGAFAAIRGLCAAFSGRVWIVSKCGPRIEARSRRWLSHHGFHDRTNVPAENLRFCRARPDKAVHARKLFLTHFVDDRGDVLMHLEGIVPYRFLFGPQRNAIPSWAIAVGDWAAARRAIFETLTRGERTLAERTP